MARVICWVFFTERMRRLISSCVGMGVSARKPRLARRGGSRRKSLLEFGKGFLQTFTDFIVDCFPGGDLIEQRSGVSIGKSDQVALEALHFRDVDAIQVTAGSRKDHENFFFNRQRREL